MLRRLDGVLHGDYRTLFRGYGLDLADLREYVYHDDVRHIDWNVTARLATPYVREYHEEREVAGWFLLDLSPSVAFGSQTLEKRAVAADFVAVLARILTAHGNRVGALLYGVTIPTHTLPAMLVTLAVGAFSFSCLGFALAAAIPTAEAAPAVTNATVLPLYFLSGVFIPQDELPNGVINFSDAFPIRHFFEAMFTAWDPNTTGAGFEWGHLAIVAAWGLFGLLIAVRFFRWEPRR